ncbi:MAG: SMP-30/gluconolactonase/LRE family protein [Sneathiella sp.]|nr:SMP-30/gluconolactonase/LRE family protein [Sneathiella sp.]
MAESDFEILDDSFRTSVKTSARIEKLWDQGRWTEGPAYFPASKSLIWSDIPNDRIMRWDETTGHVGVFRGGLGAYSNGNTVDRQGRLVSCEHGGRRIIRIEHDGSVTVLADRYNGKRLNSPNDVVVKSDGSIWFTDPAYGIDSNYEGFKAEAEVGGDFVFRLDPQTGNCRIVADDFRRPNGLAFSIDEKKLYIADTGGSHYPSDERHIRVFDVNDDGRLSGGEVFATCTSGFFDGFRLDDTGRIWTSTTEGVHCLNREGKVVGKMYVPERVSNVCFGGQKRNRLFITATTSVYAVLLPVDGAKLF